MRIDLPTCGFKNCRYYFDGNCKNKIEYEKCDYAYLKYIYYMEKNHIFYTDNVEELKEHRADANRIAEARKRTEKYEKR